MTAFTVRHLSCDCRRLDGTECVNTFEGRPHDNDATVRDQAQRYGWSVGRTTSGHLGDRCPRTDHEIAPEPV